MKKLIFILLTSSFLCGCVSNNNHKLLRSSEYKPSSVVGIEAEVQDISEHNTIIRKEASKLPDAIENKKIIILTSEKQQQSIKELSSKIEEHKKELDKNASILTEQVRVNNELIIGLQDAEKRVAKYQRLSLILGGVLALEAVAVLVFLGIKFIPRFL